MAKKKTARTGLQADFRAAKKGGRNLSPRQKRIREAIQKAKRTQTGVVITQTDRTGKSNLQRDYARQNALPPGIRISRNGKIYYEKRKNRSDIGRT